MTRYFAYGANMSRAAMRRRCPEACVLGIARLDGYKFYVGRAGWGSVKPARGGAVHGVLWKLTPRDLAALHAFELLHKGLYEVRPLPVRQEARQGGQLVPALTYLLRRREPGQPKPGYVEMIAAAAREWQLPEPYIRSVERWSVSRFTGAREIDVGEPA
jgi:AIG2-like family